jgi:hypothetical protein
MHQPTGFPHQLDLRRRLRIDAGTPIGLHISFPIAAPLKRSMANRGL